MRLDVRGRRPRPQYFMRGQARPPWKVRRGDTYEHPLTLAAWKWHLYMGTAGIEFADSLPHPVL